MARLKTHYKKYASGGAVDGLDVHPDLDVKIESDDPSAAFQRQIDALRRAESHVAQAATQPQHGLTERQQAFLDANPEMLDQPERLSRALLDAHKAGHEPDSDNFHKHVADAFRIQHLETAAHNKAAYLGHQPGTAEHQRAASDNLDDLIADVNDDPPKFFKPKPTSEPSRSAMFSAPVSREGTVVSRGGGSYQGDNPRRITLSAQEKEIARALGQSEITYAEGKIELARRKAEGMYDH